MDGICVEEEWVTERIVAVRIVVVSE